MEKLTILGEIKKAVPKSLGEVIGSVDSLIALGKKVYPIIEAGKPVLSYQLPVSHVLPKINDVNDDHDITLGMMENWKFPSKRSYKVVCKNIYGMEVITLFSLFTFNMVALMKERKYLTGVFVSATNLHVA